MPTHRVASHVLQPPEQFQVLAPGQPPVEPALAEELAGLSGRIGELVATLRSIGTPETRQAHEEVLAQLSALREDVAKANGSLASALVEAKDHNRVHMRGLWMTVLGANVVLVIVVVAGVPVTVIAR